MIRCGEPPFYECSSWGDRRFSALYARIKARGNQTIEELYQASKVFVDGSTGLPVHVARGKRPVNIEAAHKFYGQLWDEYITENPALLDALRQHTGLQDRFGQEGHACQAIELWRIRKLGPASPGVDTVAS